MSERHTVVSVDLDDVTCYHRIHGLKAPTKKLDVLVWTCWLPRLLKIFSETGTRATLFVIGRSLDEVPREILEPVFQHGTRLGHEFGNHSYEHAYDMIEWSHADKYKDIERCDEKLRSFGVKPVGFRAPGYLHDVGMLQQVAALGYRYDSSSLPSPLYYLAKLGMIQWMKLKGRPSKAPTSGVGTFLRPPFVQFRSDVGLWQVPISVTPRTRLPLVGTALFAQSGGVSGHLRATATSLPSLHLQLHAIDMADEKDGKFVEAELSPELVKRQPEFRTSLEDRTKWLKDILTARGSSMPIRSALEL